MKNVCNFLPYWLKQTHNIQVPYGRVFVDDKYPRVWLHGPIEAINSVANNAAECFNNEQKFLVICDHKANASTTAINVLNSVVSKLVGIRYANIVVPNVGNIFIQHIQMDLNGATTLDDKSSTTDGIQNIVQQLTAYVSP